MNEIFKKHIIMTMNSKLDKTERICEVEDRSFEII